MKTFASLLPLKACASIALVAALGGVSPQSASAGEMTCPDPISTATRSMTLNSAVWCGTHTANIGGGSAATVASVRGNGTWAELGGMAGDEGETGSLSDNYLTIGVNSPGWGYIPVSGTWSIGSGFWSNDGGANNRAILTTHLGGGNASQFPESFLFEVTPGAKSGSWSIAALQGNQGGGLSNFYLWGCSAATNATDCGTSIPLKPPGNLPVPGPLGLLGLGLLGMTLSRRKLSRME